MQEYNLSKDYHTLYEALQKGAVALGFVPNMKGRLLDAVKITKRSGDGYIIGCRGIEYNGTFNNRRDFFVDMCEESKLQYVPFTDKNREGL